ncbi:hypothetical protein OAA46_00300, partial [bacterium]|nr:hypothetical protein [bacterium]
SPVRMAAKIEQVVGSGAGNDEPLSLAHPLEPPLPPLPSPGRLMRLLNLIGPIPNAWITRGISSRWPTP